jgi:hypothetical protein
MGTLKRVLALKTPEGHENLNRYFLPLNVVKEFSDMYRKSPQKNCALRLFSFNRFTNDSPTKVENTPDTIRTCDLSFRKAALYPTELRGHA